jgi:preprotein translocase subunit YajC
MERRFVKSVLAAATLVVASSLNAMAMAARPDPNAPQPPAWAQWVPIAVMIGVFYLLLIRPQMRQRKNHQAMVEAMKKGDKVVTQGGLIGVVVNVGPTVVDIKLNEETKVKVLKSAVTEILPNTPDETPAPTLSVQ